VNHLSTCRKRNQRDSLSSGERNGKSLNLVVRANGGCRAYCIRVRNFLDSGKILERSTKEGDSPVGEIKEALDMTLSKTEHEKFCLKQGRPLSKAKYEIATDSEQVP
jgi:hypothetical protein